MENQNNFIYKMLLIYVDKVSKFLFRGRLLRYSLASILGINLVKYIFDKNIFKT